jgi:hypothetical protein
MQFAGVDPVEPSPGLWFYMAFIGNLNAWTGGLAVLFQREFDEQWAIGIE